MIYAIGDLHLGLALGKTMDQFGPQWEKHHEKVKSDWILKVKEEDLVLIAGDTSWAMTLEEAVVDLTYIKDLPGHKLLIKGNHDYWWGSLSKVKKLFSKDPFFFLQNDCFNYQDLAICGTRGWNCPNATEFTAEDEKIYHREVSRLRMSLNKAAKSQNILVMMHFPPMNDNQEPSGFTKLFEEYGVQHVIYGHVHGENSFQSAPIGLINNVYYQLVSADYLKFMLTTVDMEGL